MSSEIDDDYGYTWDAIVTGTLLTPVILLGILGNICSLLVWVKGRRRKTSTARFLSALAVADIIVLVTSALEFWLSHVYPIYIRLSSEFACRFFFYMSYSGPTLSAWILVAVTVERTLSVWAPHKINVLCKPVTALCVLAAVVLGVILVYLPFAISVRLDTVVNNATTFYSCNLLPGSIFAQYIEEWIFADLCLFFIVPYAVLIIGNGLILGKVLCMSRTRKKQRTVGAGTRQAANSKSDRMLRTVTRRIVVLSVVFLVCNAPLSILNSLLATGTLQRTMLQQEVEYYRVPFHILMYLNNAVNFLLYCAIGSGFRKDLAGIFSKRSRNSSS